MKSKMTNMAVLAVVVLVLGAIPALATTTSITLAQANQGTVFIGTGSTDSVEMDLGNCVGTTCTLTGGAKGTGLFASTGPYTITSPADTVVDLTNPTTGLWTAATDGDTMTFSYGPGGSLLTGYLNLLQFQKIPNSMTGSQNWYLTSASLTVTGGSLDIAAGDDMTLYYSNVPANLNSLLGVSGSTIGTSFGHGTLAPTPEPASVLLLGIGFLSVGTVLRLFRSRRGVSG